MTDSASVTIKSAKCFPQECPDLPKRTATGAVLLLSGLSLGYLAGAWSVERRMLAPLTQVVVAEADLGFEARLDTGATVSSINAQDVTVIGGDARPGRDDVGRIARFVLINGAGERRTLRAPIAQVRGVRMADCREVRYHVYLTIVHRGRAHRVLTNLNDRSAASDKLLLGRNWLQHGYAVRPVDEVEPVSR